MKDKKTNRKIIKEITQINQNSRPQICGVSIWRILGYFIIYSLLGYIIEVLYGLISAYFFIREKCPKS